jgi:integrase
MRLPIGPPKTPAAGNPNAGIPAIIRGPHFHDLRRSHKTWLVEDGVPEIAQSKRLGHRVAGVPGIYSHVSAAVEQRLVDALKTRWKQHAPRRQHDNPTNQ